MELFTLTEKKRTVGEKVAAIILLIFAVVFLIGTVLTPLFLLVGIILGIIWYFVQFRRYFEFELSYFDGEFRVARVINKSRRKKIASFSMDEVVLIAPMGDRSVYKYENDAHVKAFRCYSLEADAKPYEIIVKEKDIMKMFVVEMDERMLSEICKKYQQKVIRMN